VTLSAFVNSLVGEACYFQFAGSAIWELTREWKVAGEVSTRMQTEINISLAGHCKESSYTFQIV
jgi:hypothetical protein